MTATAPRLALALSLAAGALIGLPTLASADNSGTIRASAPGPAAERHAAVLPGRVQGRGAITALGDNLPRVARFNDLSAARLTSILRDDHTAWLSSEGRLFYQEDAPAESTVTTSPRVAPAYSANQTWTLHSNPTATRKIFLDFDGATVESSAWNREGTRQITPAKHIGFDTDGKPDTFTSSELGFVQEVWRQVSESYAPFQVDVTTEDPGVAGIVRSSSGDTGYGTQVLITSSPTPRAQVCGGCLGVAYVGTFDNVSSSAYYQPAWVFAYDLGFDPMVIAQAATHETGHTLGLSHDGTATKDYYAGTSAWGPIMGSSRERAVSQFSLGEYAGGNNHEDDFAIMASNGLPLRSDDHGDGILDADALGTRTSYDVNGVIEDRLDKDTVAITLPCVTNLSVSATGIGAQTALDLKLEILDAAGVTVATSSPDATRKGSPPVSGGMDAQASVASATGVYYLRVDGVGYGDATSAGSGWSDYGSVGQYHLTASGCPATPILPTPTPTPTSTPSPSPTPTPSPSPTPTPSPSASPTPSQPPTPAPPATAPGAPVIRNGTSGTSGGAVTAIARWAPPTNTGGAAITKYRVRAQKLDAKNRVTRTYGSAYLEPTARSLTMKLAKGRYVFAVTAYNSVGKSGWSHTSHGVYAR